MPSNKTHQTMARQWELLKLLPSKGPGKTAGDLTKELKNAGFTVGKRTVERDLRDLSSIFPLECNEKAAPFGWYWMAGAELNLPGLSLADSLSLSLVHDYLRLLLPAPIFSALEPRFAAARAKLATLADKIPAATWLDKVLVVQPTLPLVPPQINPAVLENLQEALLQELQVDCAYIAGHSVQPSELRLHPLAFVQRGPAAYLVATAYSYDDVRLYAVHRFNEVKLTSEPCSRPVDFDLKTYAAKGSLHFGYSGMFKLEALVCESLSRILLETPLSEDQTLERHGEQWKVTATVNDTWQLKWWILSHGAEIEVTSPKELRETIAKDLHEAAERYI